MRFHRLFVCALSVLSVSFSAAAASKFGKANRRANTVPSIIVNQGLSIQPTQQCSTTQMSCNTSRDGFLSTTDCLDSAQSYTDIYRFDGTTGQNVTIELTSPNPGIDIIDPYLTLFAPDGSFAAQNDDAPGFQLNARVIHTLNSTGSWLIAVSSAEPRDTGEYNLRLICSGTQTSCTPGPTTLCLNNNRFKVEARWTTPSGQTGNGNAVSLTSDSGYLWFFDSANIEMVVKLLNACSFSNRYWVFAAGLTNVDVVTTITDTRTGAVKIYRNPQGTAFQPVQDTDAFATCP